MSFATERLCDSDQWVYKQCTVLNISDQIVNNTDKVVKFKVNSNIHVIKRKVFYNLYPYKYPLHIYVWIYPIFFIFPHILIIFAILYTIVCSQCLFMFSVLFCSLQSISLLQTLFPNADVVILLHISFSQPLLYIAISYYFCFFLPVLCMGMGDRSTLVQLISMENNDRQEKGNYRVGLTVTQKMLNCE